MVHFFFIDYANSGHYYRIGIECEERVVAEEYLRQYSNDVRYHQSNEKGKRDKGKRRIPIGTIRHISYTQDKCTTSNYSRCRNAPIDSRHRGELHEAH